MSDEPVWSVYFVAGGGGTKVGVATDPERRLRQLAASSPLPLRLVLAVAARSQAQAHRIEAHVLARVADRRLHGEWFSGEVTEAEATSLLKGCFEQASDLRRSGWGRPRKARRRPPRAERPDWTPERWRRHDERVRALREAAQMYDNPEAREILREMEASLTKETIERLAARAEEWYLRQRKALT